MLLYSRARPASCPLPGLVRALALLVLAAAPAAQTWESWATAPNDQAFVQLDYPVVFVASQGHANPSNGTPVHLGLDAVDANNPAPQGPAGGLWVLLPHDGSVKKLFPLPHHEAAPLLIDTKLGELGNGAAVSPSVSEDGRTLYFTYFQDQVFKFDSGGFQQLRLSYKGADLYALDVGPLVDDPTTDPATLEVRRLTTKQYNNFYKDDTQQHPDQKFQHAVNPELAQSPGASYWGTVDMHMIEMRTAQGLKAVWVSDRARTVNSNAWVGDANHTFNLMIADILEDGRLGPATQFQYYTTTSAISPIPLRNGFAFSYQSSTDDRRRWDIQAIDSVGRWSPLIGYGHGADLFHLGTLVVTEEEGGSGYEDHFIGVKYYNVNNGGFGGLHALAMEDAGTNEFVPVVHATEPRQLSELLTLGVLDNDLPSPQVDVNGTLMYVGKFSSPSAGRVGGEYLMSYTPTSANRSKPDADGNKGVYHARIAYRPNLEPFEPHEAIDPVAGEGLYTVVRDRSLAYDLMWPTPLLTWEERTGAPQQDFSDHWVQPDAWIPRGLPLAEVGTSAVYNTDIRPYDCYLGGTGTQPFSPNGITVNQQTSTSSNVEGLRIVQDPRDFCKYLGPEAVLGIAVNLTSTRVEMKELSDTTYTTYGENQTTANGHRESVELLGVYSVVDENVADQSFQALIPAKVPFEFQLLDRDYGMKLVDVRSWHSLRVRETRNDCGGCHQHEAGFAIPFAGTEADSKPPLDMSFQTKFVEYDADCKPVLTSTTDPTVQLPEWTEDVWPGFDNACSACHRDGVATDPLALAAFSYDGEETAYDVLRERNYANSSMGALGSPAFWAAYGERTDGRDNDLLEYQPDYALEQWGYRFSSVHASNPGLCAASDPQLASWVRNFGVWIDNHMPRNTGFSSFGYKFDRYPPTLDMALTDVDVGPLVTRIGYWDNSGSVTLRFEINGAHVITLPNLPNGAFTVPAPFAFLALHHRIRVIATDGEGNRQVVEKSVQELFDEWLADPS